MNKDHLGPLIIFDGVCNFCDASVNFIMNHDKNARFKFSASQHEGGERVLESFGIHADEVDTLYLLENGQLYDRSTAALRIARHLDTPWNWFYHAFICLPKTFRDPVYNLIARNRYRLFGKKEACRMPSPEERARFI